MLSVVNQYTREQERKKKEHALAFTTLTAKGVLNFEKMVLSNHQDLKDYYYEMYQPLGYPKDDSKKQCAFHLTVYMIQIMEDVFTVEDLDNEKNFKDKSLQGWLRLFKIWTNSATFKTMWQKLKYVYGDKFIDFVDNKIIKNDALTIPS